MDAARVDLQRYADEARELLTPLPEGPAKHALVEVCDAVVSRSA